MNAPAVFATPGRTPFGLLIKNHYWDMDHQLTISFMEATANALEERLPRSVAADLAQRLIGLLSPKALQTVRIALCRSGPPHPDLIDLAIQVDPYLVLALLLDRLEGIRQDLERDLSALKSALDLLSTLQPKAP